MSVSSTTDRPFEVGDYAKRIDLDLDARAVAAVSNDRLDGQRIRLSIGGLVTDWLPASLYRNEGKPGVTA